MTYYDIHTHQEIVSRNNFVIQNKQVEDKQALCFLPGHYYSYGIHPWSIENISLQMQWLTEGMLHPGVLALGEAGLDKFIETPMDLQVEVFAAQAVLAEETDKPLIIHCVKAWDELFAVKKKIHPQVPWIIHGFRGNRILAEQLVKKGFWISFGEYYNEEAVRLCWPERLFLETDESSLSIESIYTNISNLLNLSIDLLAFTLRKHVQEVFSVRFEK
ncbi:MAG: TatD family hydrolase [Massilibacteroides sp.]|nr:TatD family hydrolase [Massilibacteroides sp.]MDD3062097.1 TatD family hydrolase [Massilibacteroides sp.]MDD4114079.1 TatD family hydrolase [Massilibacteroides sp.]MDD4659641.1 TatD family hydrolase [Massilibacteroides sp.]